MVGTSPAELFPTRRRAPACGRGARRGQRSIVRRALRRATSCATSRSRPDRARSSAWPASRARAWRRCSASCSGRAARPRARSASPTAGAPRPPRPPPPDAASASCRPTAGSQGLMLESSVETNIAQVAVGALPVASAVAGPRVRCCAAAQAPDRPRSGSRRTARGRSSDACRAATSRRSSSAKWLEIAPTVLLLDDPTRGVDVGAKREIYRAHPRARRRGPDRPLPLHRAARGRRPGRSHPRPLSRPARPSSATAATIDDHGLLHAINTGRPPDAAPARHAATEEVIR